MGARAKFAIWVYIRTFEIKTEYCFFKDAERIVFLWHLLLWRQCVFALNGGIPDIKIGQKAVI